MVNPVDKRENYIKRCVGLPGDTVLITRGVVFVNNKKLRELPTQEFKYYVRTYRNRLSDSILCKAGVDPGEINYNPDEFASYHPPDNARRAISQNGCHRSKASSVMSSPRCLSEIRRYSPIPPTTDGRPMNSAP